MPVARAQRELSVRRGSRFVPSGYLAKLATFHNRQQRARNKGGLCDLVAEHISVNPYRNTMGLGDFSSAWPRDLAFCTGLEAGRDPW